MLDELMHPTDVKPPFMRMHIVVIIAYVCEVAPVIKNAHLERGIPGMI
jgi:hypothetical protein